MIFFLKQVLSTYIYSLCLGAQGLSVRVLDSRQRSRGFKPHRHHCVVSSSMTHLSLLSTGSTQEGLSQHNWIVDWDLKNQIKQTKLIRLNTVSTNIGSFNVLKKLRCFNYCGEEPSTETHVSVMKSMNYSLKWYKKNTGADIFFGNDEIDYL